VKYFEADATRTQLGLAYSATALAYLDAHPDALDYIEIPFEQLRHTPEAGALQSRIPLVLHCASVSVAGTVAPSTQTLDAIAATAAQLRTPWIGEHLAFVSAEGLEGEADAPEPTALTYTVCPQLSEASVERVVANLDAARARLGATPLLLENSPQYFPIPGSTMPMSAFVAAVFARCDAGLLLDLTHFLITCLNTGADPMRELERMPLDRVVEVHISGLSVQSGIAWDDHAIPASPQVFQLLQRVLREVRPQALTVEYNWSAAFPQTILHQHLQRVRDLLEVA
jgi:uncharacterized protein